MEMAFVLYAKKAWRDGSSNYKELLKVFLKIHLIGNLIL